MLRFLIVLAVIIGYASALIDSKLESAEVHLSDQFFVPASGHVKCLHSTTMTAKPLELNSLEDVVAFYKRCNEIKFNQESVTSLRFFEKIGLEVKAEKTLPPPQIPNQQVVKEPIKLDGPRWLPTTLDFDQSRHASEIQFNGNKRRWVTGPKLDISVASSANWRQVTHADSPNLRKKRIDSADLFSRSDRWLDQNAKEENYQGFSLYSIDYDKATQYILAETGRDSICARITISKSNNRPSAITFHLGLKPNCNPKPYSLPSLTLVFRKTGSIDQWKLQGYFIQDALLDKPLLETAFAVPLNRGDVYVGIDSEKKDHEVRKVIHEYKDLTQVAPQNVLHAQNPNPGLN